MSSRKLSDKEFDRYARNILKKSEGVPFDNSAWAAMEQQLAQQATTSSFFSLKWLIPITIIVLSGVTYLTYQYIDSQPEETSEQLVSEQASTLTIASSTGDTNQTVSNKEITDGADQSPNEISDAPSITDADNEKPTPSDETNQGPSFTKSSPGTTDEVSLKNQPTEPNNEYKPQVTATEEKVSSSSVSSNEKDDLPKSGNSKGPLQEAAGINSGIVQTSEIQKVSPVSTMSEENKGQKETLISDDTKDQRPASFGSNNISEDEDLIWFLESKGVLIVYADVDEGNPILLPLEETYNENITSGEKDEDDLSKSISKKWAIGLVLAPDFSTVESFNEFTNPGLDVGLNVQYFLGRRLSITTGAILTRKLYNTSNLEAYTVPQGFWNGGEAPELITADCKVIDIPINLRYQLIEGDLISIFASAGMSSYLMLNEIYGYEYSSGQYSGSQPRSWEVSNENNHFFGVYNLSIGITKKLSERISLEAEPFIKNSLGGVGWGQVRLNSTGMLMHLKFHF